jgi:hypothetical protein
MCKPNLPKGQELSEQLVPNHRKGSTPLEGFHAASPMKSPPFQRFCITTHPVRLTPKPCIFKFYQLEKKITLFEFYFNLKYTCPSRCAGGNSVKGGGNVKIHSC